MADLQKEKGARFTPLSYQKLSASGQTIARRQTPVRV